MSGEHKQEAPQGQRQPRAEETTIERKCIYRDIVQRLVGKRLAVLVLGGEPGALASEPQDRTEAEEEQLEADVKAMVEANRKAEFHGPYRLDYVDDEGYLHSIVKGKGCECGSSSCPLMKMLSEDFRWEPAGDARPRDHAVPIDDEETRWFCNCGWTGSGDEMFLGHICPRCNVSEPQPLVLTDSPADTESSKLRHVLIRHEGDDPGHGTKLYIDGFEVPELTNVSFSHPVREIAQVKAQVNALRGFELDVRAEVRVEITAFEGEIISEPLPDGRVRYRCVSQETAKTSVTDCVEGQEPTPVREELDDLVDHERTVLRFKEMRCALENLVKACAECNRTTRAFPGNLRMDVLRLITEAQNVALSYQLLKDREGGAS